MAFCKQDSLLFRNTWLNDELLINVDIPRLLIAYVIMLLFIV